ncbi:MAG TPA: GNAT family N-acetyltransferase [Kofleriaceae bacterium]|nr:GNAT family N-acetyltransferase [Kofleriaceae bacterium]
MAEVNGVTAPVLETERLVLRAHTRADFDDSARLWGDPEVVRFIGGEPFDEEIVWFRLLRHVGHWALLGFGYWVARERATGRFVGEVGLADLHRIIEPGLDAPEAGWVLAPWAHGRGFATEAVRRVLAWSDAHLGPRTTCIIEEGHTASFHVAAKCGFRELAKTTYKGSPTVVLARDA